MLSELTIPRPLSRFLLTTLFLFACFAQTSPALAVEQFVVKREGQTLHLAGRVVQEAEDGGLLLLAPEGLMWVLQANEIVSRTKDDEPFKPLGQKELAEKLLAELPEGFRVHTTAHYIVCYNTSAAYAQWCGGLYERLFRGFHNYWENKGFKLSEPEFPLVALVFDGKPSYTRFVRNELGDAAGAIVGFYSPTTNRVNMYDLTGVEGVKTAGERLTTGARINQILSQPAAAPTVATIVHEATHQLAYNCGLQVRLAHNPVWVSEGLAVFFETPDLRDAKGWGNIGSVNRGRLLQFRKYLANRPADSLEKLLSSDGRFHDTLLALDAYAEAWALNYFLLRMKSKEYVAYLKELSASRPAVQETPAERLDTFRKFFGDDLKKFDQEFLRSIRAIDVR